MTLVIIISIVVLLFLIIILRKKKKHLMDDKLTATSSEDKASTSYFMMCSAHSISLAFENIDRLSKNNERDKRHFKSFRSLGCTREDLKRSFYFLKDCVYFCKNERIYNDKKLLDNLGFLEMQVVMCYIDADPNDIPQDRIENYKFGKQFELDKDLDEKQLAELKLINWRSKEQWKFWANKYGSEGKLGQYCLEQANLTPV